MRNLRNLEMGLLVFLGILVSVASSAFGFQNQHSQGHYKSLGKTKGTYALTMSRQCQPSPPFIIHQSWEGLLHFDGKGEGEFSGKRQVQVAGGVIEVQYTCPLTITANTGNSFSFQMDCQGEIVDTNIPTVPIGGSLAETGIQLSARQSLFKQTLVLADTSLNIEMIENFQGQSSPRICQANGTAVKVKHNFGRGRE